MVVGFGDTGGDPGVTTGFKDGNGAYFSLGSDGNVKANILVTFKESAGSEDFINAVAHEGQHVADRQSVANAINTDPNFTFPSRQTVRTTETRAYYVSAMVAQGRNQETWRPNGYEIWNRAWSKTERMDLISKGINTVLTKSKSYKDKLNEPIYK